METRVAVISIIIDSTEKINEVNELLHEYAAFVIGRLGLPYREKQMHIICIAIDAPQDAINTLTGRLGKIDGISAKAAYSKNG